jgi:hypothetical protein
VEKALGQSHFFDHIGAGRAAKSRPNDSSMITLIKIFALENEAETLKATVRWVGWKRE